MSKFLQEQKNKGKVFSSEDEIMSVFLDYLEASRKSEDKKYLELLLSYTHKSTINDITFNDLRDLSIFEDSKVEKGISNYITESISKENVKILVDLQTQRFRDALPSSDRKKRNDVLKDK
ncbi:MAG: hypothetical protein Q8O99_01605 [bacterium]|nr:hypothetical protein [bacterium]